MIAGTFLRPLVSASAWARLHGIEPFTVLCECGRERTASVPIAIRNLRGLQCPPCACRKAFAPYCVVAVDGQLESIFSAVRK